MACLLSTRTHIHHTCFVRFGIETRVALSFDFTDRMRNLALENERFFVSLRQQKGGAKLPGLDT